MAPLLPLPRVKLLALLAVHLLLAGGAEAGPRGVAKAVPGQADSTFEQLQAAKAQLVAGAKLPVESQKALLKLLGAGLAASDQLECNLFGGKAACEEIPQDSSFARSCKDANKAIDCAFKSEAAVEMEDDPQLAMREKLAKQGYPECDQCFDALHDFWCAQTIPSCGTFDLLLDEILPVISRVVNNRMKPVVALQLAVPRILEAFSLGLPCREMCDGLARTCGCGKQATFGQVMTSLRKSSPGAKYATNMSSATSRNIFKGVWNQPVCKLFAPKDMPGFVGVCDLPKIPVPQCPWCKRGKGPTAFNQQIVAQMAEFMSAMMQAGVQRVLDTTGQGGHWNWAEDKEKHSNTSLTILTWIFIVGLTVSIIGAIAVFVATRYGAEVADFWEGITEGTLFRRRSASQYLDLNTVRYTPPGM